MAVSSTVAVRIFPLPQLDQRDPIGQYYGGVSLAGDASGGANERAFTLPQPNAYNVEIVYGVPQGSAATTAHVVLIRPGILIGSVTWEFAFGLDIGVIAGVNSFWGGPGPRGWSPVWPREWIFRPTDSDGTIFVSSANINLETEDAFCMGFVWSQDAFKIPGGPRLPHQGVPDMQQFVDRFRGPLVPPIGFAP